MDPGLDAPASLCLVPIPSLAQSLSQPIHLVTITYYLSLTTKNLSWVVHLLHFMSDVLRDYYVVSYILMLTTQHIQVQSKAFMKNKN